MRRALARVVLLRSVAAAVKLAERRHDPSELADEDVLEDAEELRAFLFRDRRRGVPKLDLAVAEGLAFFHWYRYVYLDSAATDDVLFAVSLFRRLAATDAGGDVPYVLAPLFGIGVDPRSARPHPADLRALVSGVADLFDHAKSDDGRCADLESAITLARYAMAVGRGRDGIDADVRTDLAQALVELAHLTGDQEALDEAVEQASAALRETPHGEPEWLARAGLLGLTTAQVAWIRHDEGALRQSLHLLRPAVRATAAGHPHRPYAATALLYAITVRYEWLGGSDLTVENPARLRALLAMIPEDTPGRDGTIEELATALWHRYLYLDGGLPLDEPPLMVELFAHLHGLAPGLVPPFLAPLFDPTAEEGAEDEGDLHTLVSLASDLYTYAEEPEEERREEIERAATLARRAAAFAAGLPSIETDTRGELARVLLNTFHHTQDAAALGQALRHARETVAQTPPDHEDWLGRAAVLGGALAEIADLGHDAEALGEAITLLAPAVHRAVSAHPSLDAAAGVLTRALTLRSSWNSLRSGMAESARDLRALLDLLPDDAPLRDQLEPVTLNIEAFHLLYQGDASGAQSVHAALDRVVGRLTAGTADHDRWGLMSAALSVILASTGGLIAAPELARYREVFRAETTLDPDERASNLTLLCALLTMSVDPAIYVRPTGDPSLLDECVTLLTEGLTTVPADSAEHRGLRVQLGATLVRRFRHIGDRADLDRATLLLREGRRELVDGRADPSDLTTTRSELAYALREHHLLTGDEGAYEEAMLLLRESVADAEQVPIARLVDAYAAGGTAARAGRWRDAADAYASGVGLAARGAWRFLRRVDQEEQLGYFSGLANEAAATAILSGDLGRAVTMLEHGRAVLFHQGLDARGHALRLRAERPDLASRLDRIEEETEIVTDARRRRDLAADWRHLLAEIRAQPGFASFLHPPQTAALRPASGQTVVLLNPADVASHALLLTAAGVRAVPLPALTTADIRDRVTTFNQALTDLTRAGGRGAAVVAVTETLDWLWHTTAEPVLAALGHLDTPPETAPWPRIHWCPTWMLTFLPVHAAAAQRPTGPAQSVLDRVVSSYTPSLHTLHTLQALSWQQDPPPDRRSLLLVSLPQTPDLPPLAGVEREAEGLAGLGVPATALSGPAAVRSAVSTAMREHAWAHFACHASHDLTDPSRGRLLLHDHRENPFTVLEISRLRLEHARLAYLSACDTGRGGLRLPDEAIHVGGALQLAGYQHVIATLWGVNDTIAARMTERVYGDLRTPDGRALEPCRTAVALHAATRALRRRYPQDPSLWAGYVHLGP